MGLIQLGAIILGLVVFLIGLAPRLVQQYRSTIEEFQRILDEIIRKHK